MADISDASASAKTKLLTKYTLNIAMNIETLEGYQKHTQDLIDFLKEAKEMASTDYYVDRFIEIARNGLIYLISEIEPNNELARIMLANSINIECRVDQSELLINAGSVILNIINNQKALVDNALNVECYTDKSEFLIDAGSSVFKTTNKQLKCATKTST